MDWNGDWYRKGLELLGAAKIKSLILLVFSKR